MGSAFLWGPEFSVPKGIFCRAAHCLQTPVSCGMGRGGDGVGQRGFWLAEVSVVPFVHVPQFLSVPWFGVFSGSTLSVPALLRGDRLKLLWDWLGLLFQVPLCQALAHPLYVPGYPRSCSPGVSVETRGCSHLHGALCKRSAVHHRSP